MSATTGLVALLADTEQAAVLTACRGRLGRANRKLARRQRHECATGISPMLAAGTDTIRDQPPHCGDEQEGKAAGLSESGMC